MNVRRDLHSEFLYWVKTEHTPDEAIDILDAFVQNGLYPEEFLKKWRESNAKY